jgi:hypothetical protein
MHPSRGQGTVEYLGVVALVALVGGAAATVAVAGGRDIARAVPREVIRALCLVGGGDCDRDRKACPVRSRALRAGATVRVAFVRLGRHHGLVEELRSDGTVALTLVEERAGGAEAGTGARAALRLGGSVLAIGGGVRAAALVRAGRGSTWIVPRGARAEALRSRLRAHFRVAPARELAPGFLARRVLPELPPPVESFGDAGLEVSAGASASRGMGSLAASLSAEELAGSRIDHVGGGRTFYIRRRNALEGSGSAAGATAAGTGEHGSEYALTVDRGGRPIDLAVIETGSLAGSIDLPTRLQPVAGLLDLSGRGRRAWVTETHLDLTDAESLAVAGRALRALRDPALRVGDAVAVSVALERRLAEHGVVDARAYALEGERYGGELDARVGGVGAGVDVEVGGESARLVAAVTRGIDGQWRRRDDCLAAARA